MIEELVGRRASHDRAKQLEPTVVGVLRERYISALVPEVIGGAEKTPAEYVAMLEAIAESDSASGWVTMTASTSAMLSAYLPRTTADLLWKTGTPMMAGVFAPGGQIVDGTLSGKWSWGSGSRHADWFALGCMFEHKHVVAFVPAASVQIVENWDTLGLAGTGSHDLVVDRVRIGADHTCSVFGKPWADTALYRVPVFGLLAVGIASCALGIAKAALGHAADRLRRDGEKVASPALTRYAELYGELAAARAYLIATCNDVFARGGDALARGQLRLAAHRATQSSLEVARGCFHLDGAAAVRAGHPLQLALRDLEVVMTHKMVVEKVLPSAARALLGGPAAPDL
ncbi:MAG: hypothetical protein QM831_17500 [Kofleriaceae bacterium]